MIAAVVFFALFYFAVGVQVPILNLIIPHDFQMAYSCGGSYNSSALYLTNSRYEPHLLFNGACDSQPYFDVNLAGDDFGVIADLGPVPLQNVSAHAALNFKNIAGQGNVFQPTAEAVEKHTYAVILTREEVRTVFSFTVLNLVTTGSMSANIAYAVQLYNIQKTVAASPGFDWMKQNS